MCEEDRQVKKEELFRVARFCRAKINQLTEELDYFRRIAESVSKEQESLEEKHVG